MIQANSYIATTNIVPDMGEHWCSCGCTDMGEH